MTDRERQIRQRLKDDFPHYAARCLKIVPKEAGKIPLVLNPTQMHVHRALEAQRSSTGMVRAIILKARKQGISTYTDARFFHRITHSRGMRAKVMAHQAETTKELFEMIRRFQDELPDLVRPHAERNSTHELAFGKLDSFMSVATAGSRETGRGGTPHLLHASEFQLWANAGSHMAGVIKSVPDTPGTEIILEGTGNGQGNTFHDVWQKAVSGENLYTPIFIPWFMDPTYRAQAPEGFTVCEEEAEIARIHGLDLGQMYWRRLQIADLTPWRFKREFPATPNEAFSSGTDEPLIDGNLVLMARARRVEGYGKIYAGIDPARKGKDRTALVIRQGPKVLFQQTWKISDAMALIGAMRPVLDRYKPARIFVDEGGLGGPIHDRLKELRYPVTEIQFGATALDKTRFVNLKAEMWDKMREWLADGQILDSDEMEADLCGPGYDHDSNGRLQLEKKESLEKRGIRSPDLGDALALSIIGPLVLAKSQVRVISY